MSSRSKQRHALVLSALAAGEVDVDDLARRFDVSASTVRRDLQMLSQQHPIRRTYGGAILAGSASEMTFDERLGVNGPAKQAIARLAVDLVNDGDTLILDAGSTVAALGLLLQQRQLRIITNNLVLLPFLAKEQHLEIIVLGGDLRATSMSTVGSFAAEAMRRITADRFITSADGIVASRGLCEAGLDQAYLKSRMMEQARQVIVLADSSKVGRCEHNAWAPLPTRWTLVTDNNITADQKAEFVAAGAEVLTAQRQSKQAPPRLAFP